MGQNLTKTVALSHLQTLSISYLNFSLNSKFLTGFFLNEDIDCIKLSEYPNYRVNELQQAIEEINLKKQQYHCFFHPTKSSVLYVLKKNNRTEHMFESWTQNSFDFAQGDVENLMISLLKSFLENCNETQFTLYNVDITKFPRLDEIIRQLQREYLNLEITRKSVMANGTHSNCIISKHEKETKKT